MTGADTLGAASRAQRWHSLAGVVPLTAFLVLHVLANATALLGADAFEARVRAVAARPGFMVVEVLLVGVPLAYHALYGSYLVFWRRAVSPPGPGGTRLGPLQSATGVVTFAFVGYHLWQLRLGAVTGRLLPADYTTELVASLSAVTELGIPVVAMAYLLGSAAAATHCALGLTSFCDAWGLTASAAARRRARIGFGLLGVALFLIAASTVMVFARGALVLDRGPSPQHASV